MGKLSLTGNAATRDRLATLSAATPFVPTDIANLWAWYDASDTGSITASSGAVSQWADKSGNARHLTQSTGGAKPTTGSRTINSLNVLDFDGGDSLTISGISFGITNWTIYVVCGEDSTGTNNGVLCFHTGVGNDWERTDSVLFEDGNSSQVFALETGNPNSPGVGCSPSGSGAMPSTIYRLRKSGTGSNSMSAWYKSAGTTTTTTAASAGTATNMILGGRLSGAGKIDGYIAEVVIYSDANSAGDQTLVTDYLSNKWGL